MSRKNLTVLSTAAAILLTAGLLAGVWFFYFTGKGADFTLPPLLPPGSVPGASAPGAVSDGLGLVPIEVNAANVRLLLAAVERPAAYSQTIVSVSYWPGGQWETVHFWARRGNLTFVETRQEGAQTQSRLTAPGRVWFWTGGSMPYYELPAEESDAESLSGIPTWEDIAALPPETILEAEAYSLPAMHCLRVRTREPAYTAEYIISLDTGLLVRAEYTGADGNPAFLCTAGPPDLGEPDGKWFVLPDGRAVPEE